MCRSAKRDPSLRVVVLEKEFAGFGASGRNGGWASAFLPTSWEQVAAESSRDAALRLQRAADESIDEVGKVAADEGIDGHFAKGGYLRVATSPLQWDRLHTQLEHAREWDRAEDDLVLLDRTEARARVGADGVFGGLYTPHCAAIHPAKLVAGLTPPDDAAAYRVSDDLAIIGTLDFFPPLVDDPATFGAIAAANALSDVFAMGGRVLFALSIAAFPEELPRDVLAAVFEGAAAKVREAGGVPAGGHTIRDPERIAERQREKEVSRERLTRLIERCEPVGRRA